MSEEDDFESVRRDLRWLCFTLSAITFVLAILILVSACLSGSEVRAKLIGPSVFLLGSSVFSMSLTHPWRKS